MKRFQRIQIVRKRLTEPEHVNVFHDMLMDHGLHETTIAVADEIVACHKNGGRIFAFGNGGSASDADHFVGELVGWYNDKKRIRAAIGAATPFGLSGPTAIANDTSYLDVFRRYVEANVRKGDVVFGITTSGKSANVLEALNMAGALEAVTVAETGAVDELSFRREGMDVIIRPRYHIKIPSPNGLLDTPRVQEGYFFVNHMIAELVEQSLLEED